jgi:hypothetical protein
MQECIDTLLVRGLDFERMSRWQIKIDSVNYYPDRGTIFVDGDDAALKERGLDALLTTIGKLKHEEHKRRELWRSRYLSSSRR